MNNNNIVNIPFNLPYTTGREIEYIAEAIKHRHLSGDGVYTDKCQSLLNKYIGCKKSLLVPSCTAALEMAAILIDIKPGDEVIMPSYTFVSTANAFVLRGGIPVFVDIRPDTLNIDEDKIEEAITDKTKAIVVVHYAGVACEMEKIMSIANTYGLFVIEDAAQAIMSTYNGKPLGSIGHLSTFSFHATKNIISGEGGALCINEDSFLDRVEIIREKGTNRKKFFEGQVDKYTWVDIGSSYLLNEITAAFLYAQLEGAVEITKKRLALWNFYQLAFQKVNPKLAIQPRIPTNCQHNAHFYYLILADHDVKSKVIQFCKAQGISTATHFVALHESLGGKKYGRVHSSLDVTTNISSRILRIPLWIGIEQYQDNIIENIQLAIDNIVSSMPQQQLYLENI